MYTVMFALRMWHVVFSVYVYARIRRVEVLTRTRARRARHAKGGNPPSVIICNVLRPSSVLHKKNEVLSRYESLIIYIYIYVYYIMYNSTENVSDFLFSLTIQFVGYRL